jgi:hypothetical protein
MRFRVFDAQIMTPEGTEVVIQEASTFVGVQQYASIRYGYVLNRLALGTYNRQKSWTKGCQDFSIMYV